MARAAVANSWQSWLDAAAGFFYPNACQICGSERATAQEGYLCARCRSRPGAIRFITAPFCQRCGLPYEGEITAAFECSNCRQMKLHFASARAAVVAGDFLLEIIHRYKYRRAIWFEPFLADLLVRAAMPHLSAASWDLIVPIPLHPLKKREREFNQAERLAARLSVATSLPVHPRLLKRIEATRTQTMLTREQRSANVRHAFAFWGKKPLEGQRIVLLDDVLTTGATSSACAKVLLENGAGWVCVWTVARGLLK